jgi:hypothetical protein
VDRVQRDRLAERYETAIAGYRKREQVRVSYLSRAVQSLPAHDALIGQADRTWPELVPPGAGGSPQAIKRLSRGHRARVTRLADDSHEAVLGDRAGGPATLDLAIIQSLAFSWPT